MNCLRLFMISKFKFIISVVEILSPFYLYNYHKRKRQKTSIQTKGQAKMSSRSATDCEESEHDSNASSDSSDEREEHYRSSADEQSDGKENKNRKDSKSSHQPSFIKIKKQRRAVLTTKIRGAQHPLK